MKQVIMMFLLLLSIQAIAQHASLKVVMIRHGEKDEATGNLSCTGFNRALKLPAVLNAKFAKPAAIYVPSLSDKKITGHARMFQTITPFAIQDSIAINSSHKVDKDSAVAKDVMTR
ncbi:MAG: histidine phosphatase family protein, partial [Chitinophagaceae bacterium]